MKSAKNIEKQLGGAILSLNRGEIIICPTDTVYGILADAGNKKAVDAIFKIKKRPRSKPLPVFVKDFKMAKDIAEIDKKQEKILKKHWPGKYTFILKSKKIVGHRESYNLYGVDKNTVALRIPKYKFLNDLLKKINKPLVQTSANVSGQPVFTKFDQIIKFVESSKVQAFVINAGNLPKRNPSVIIDLTKEKIKILRK